MKIKEGEKRIKQLLEVIKDTDIKEIYYKKDGLNIGIRKSDLKEDSKIHEKPEKKKDLHNKIVNVTSHSVGFFRDYMLPSKKVLAKEGQVIKKGQKLGIIESMKIMKEIISPVNGIIYKKYINNGNAVEYGQKLFEVNEDV